MNDGTGKGYPHGLQKEDIPLGARIIAVADVYQVLVSNRSLTARLTRRKRL